MYARLKGGTSNNKTAKLNLSDRISDRGRPENEVTLRCKSELTRFGKLVDSHRIAINNQT